MRYPKLSAMVLALGVALPAGAQTVVQPAPDDSLTTVVSPPSVIVVEPVPEAVVRIAPVPVPDPAADAQCRHLMANAYWDCVNSHKGQ